METLRHMNEYRKLNKYCDIAVIVGESSYNAHKAVLAACSEYFADVLDNDSKQLQIDCISADEIETALNFIYTGKIEITNETVEGLLKLSEVLKLTKLRDRCEKFFKMIAEETENPEVEITDVPEAKDPDFTIDNSVEETAINEDDAPLAVEIIRSKPVSIFPISKRSERKAKQDAYKAFKMIEGYDEAFERMTRSSRRRIDEDYVYENTALASTSCTTAAVPKKRRASKLKYTCQTCGKKFDQVMVYNLHLLCHDEERENNEEIETVDSEKIIETMGQAELDRNGLKQAIMPKLPHLSCDVCGKMFSTTHNLKVHLKTHTRDVASIKSAKEKIFPCTVCGKVFKTTSHVKRHMITHTGERKHCCTTCGKLFLKNDHLKRHERTHTSERPFACEQCGKTFRDKDHLKRHHLTHSDVRPYFCEICGKQFKERNTLQSHQKVHNAVILPCNLCNRTFKGEATLKKHLLRHEQGNAHVCEVCGKNFETSGRLRKHMLTHTGDRPHHCETCGKQFRDPHSLRLHQKRHTGIGLHPCKECGKDFTNPFHLKRHMRVHSGEKPFRCESCKKTFSRSDNLEAHKKICTGKQANPKLSLPPPPAPASTLPTMVHTVTFIDGNRNNSSQQAQKEPTNIEKEISTTSASLNNILSQIPWVDPSNRTNTAQKEPANIMKETPVPVNTWSVSRTSSSRIEEEPVNLGKNMNLVHTTDELVSSSMHHPASSPPHANIHHAKRLLPNIGVSVPSGHAGSFHMNPEYVRSRYYALQSQAYHGQPHNPTTTQQYQQVQMPTPIHSNQSITSQHQAQQILNFDVNAAVNSFIGYGASL